MQPKPEHRRETGTQWLLVANRAEWQTVSPHPDVIYFPLGCLLAVQTALLPQDQRQPTNRSLGCGGRPALNKLTWPHHLVSRSSTSTQVFKDLNRANEQIQGNRMGLLLDPWPLDTVWDTFAVPSSQTRGFVWYTPFSSHPAVSRHPFHAPSLCPMGSPHFGFLHAPLVAPQLTICPCCLSPHERTGGTCVGKVQNTLSIPPVAHRMCSSTQEVRAR